MTCKIPIKKAEQEQIFDFETAQIGMKDGRVVFKPSKTLQVISGEVIALGKLDGEW